MLTWAGILSPLWLRLCHVASRIAPMAIRTASRTAPCKGDSAIRVTTYPLMSWTSSRLLKKPVAISDSYFSNVMR